MYNSNVTKPGDQSFYRLKNGALCLDPEGGQHSSSDAHQHNYGLLRDVTSVREEIEAIEQMDPVELDEEMQQAIDEVHQMWREMGVEV